MLTDMLIYVTHLSTSTYVGVVGGYLIHLAVPRLTI